MRGKSERERIQAVRRYLNGESPRSIYTSLSRSKSWFFKWLGRYIPDDDTWYRDRPRGPRLSPLRLPPAVEEIVKTVRADLIRNDLFYGAQAIRWEMEELGIDPLPSIRTINRILKRHSLVQRAKGRYQSKGKPYPKLLVQYPNQLHQADLYGPCYLKGPIRFYSLNVVDVGTGRCGVEPVFSKSAQSMINGFWYIWQRLGIPQHLQVDNQMSFFGSWRYPRGMGSLIRLCLHNKAQPWFIPMNEPWRNGVVEKFNDHYQQKFLRKITMTSKDELKRQSLVFEHRHNSCYRYSKLRGKTPLIALEQMGKKLALPKENEPPNHSLQKPISGRYHLVRYIRSNLQLNVFGEIFSVPPELQHEYVVATIDVKKQKLQLYLNHKKVHEYTYTLR